MAKKSVKNVKTESTESAANDCCQYCKNHLNHPSCCKLTKKYVGRKQKACDKFKEVK